MRKNTTATARIDALEARFDAIDSTLDRLLAAFEASATAKAEPKKARKAKSTKAAAPKSTKVEKADTPVRHLVRKNRPAFVAAHPWAAGMSTSAIAEAVVTGAQTCEPGWAIGERRTAMVLGTDAPKAKKGSKKAKARVAAKVESDAPAKERKPVGDNHASQGPRDALGRITPKSQWALRESLAETGKFDRHEIDAIVAAQV